MKKKIIISLSVLLFLGLLVFAGVSYAAMSSPKHPSDYKIGITYENALKSDKPVLALFYVDWCGYCMKFMPQFNILNKIYKGKYNLVMVNVEDSKNSDLVENIGISGFPTVYILDPKYDNRVLMPHLVYNDLAKFRVELDRYLRIRTLLDKAN